MTITIPGVRNEHNATTADVIAEQIQLCEATIEAIQQVAKYRKPREIRDEINRRLRGCHDLLGMAGSRKFGCLYREIGLQPDTAVVCEHAIPVTAMVTLYEENTPFEELVFFPVARISKDSDKALNDKKLTKSGHSNDLPLLRYHEAGIKIETHNGEEISCDKWSMEDHWKLVEQTTNLFSIREAVLSILQKTKNIN